MKVFEVKFGGGIGGETICVQPYREALWAKAFGVDVLDDLFDIATHNEAIPRIDVAIQRFNHDPETLKPLLRPEDPFGLRRNRMVLEQMRATLADHDDSTISGLIDSDEDR